MNIKTIDIKEFLYFGYSLNYVNPNYFVDFSTIDKGKYDSIDRKNLVKIGSKIFKDVLKSKFKENNKNIIPLSGGLDSRAILAGLSELTNPQNLYTYTFGTPGTYDFDIGNYIAKYFGTKHTIFDLTKHIYSLEEMLNMGQKMDYQSPLLLHPPLKLLKELCRDAVIWSGANAGAVVGSFYRTDEAKDYRTAQLRFLDKARFTKNDYSLSEKTNFRINMDSSFISNTKLTYDEQVFFKERSIKHLAPHVLLKGFDYILPFVNTSFMDFMLSVPNVYRVKKSLYKEILFYAFPQAFSLPTESNFGLHLHAPKWKTLYKRSYSKALRVTKRIFPRLYFAASPTTNYLDWDWAFRRKKDLRDIAFQLLLDLKERNMIYHINIDDIWNNHQNRKENNGDIILLLISIEIYKKNGVKFTYTIE